MPEEEREKISLFTNVPEWGVISMWDVDTIYKVPRMLHEQGLDGMVCDKLRLNTPPANLKRWDDLVYETEHPQGEVRVAMVGKYVELSDAYKSVNEALKPHGSPAMLTDSCWSYMSRARSPPPPSWSIRPLFMVAWRMLLIISRMKSDSSCLAASRAAWGVLLVASFFRPLSELTSPARALLAL